MNTFRVFGIAFIILIVVLALPLKFPVAGWKPAGWTPPALAAGQAVTCEFKREQMLKTSTFYALWACYFIGCLAGLMAIGIAKPVGVDVGVEAGLATMLVGAFAVFNGFGRPVFGTLTDKADPPEYRDGILRTDRTGITAHLADPVRAGIHPCVCRTLGMSGRLAGHRPDCYGKLFRHLRLPEVLGVMFLAYGAGGIVGPQLAGFIKMSTGSYIGVFPYVLALAVIGIVIAFTLMKPPKPIT